LAQKFYEDYKDLSYIELKDKLDKVVDDILKMINSYSNNELYESLFYEKWTLGRLVQFNTSSPYKNARGRVRKWKKEVEIF
jgi:hypothetical protein